jgi:hypothetical protein
MTDIVQKVRVLLRTRTAAEWTALNEVLRNKELGIESDTGRDKLGNGVTTWNALAYRVASGSLSSSYVHTQSTASTTWTINHNLGYRPSVELLDSGGQEIEAGVSHPTINQTVITLSPASAGMARLT